MVTHVSLRRGRHYRVSILQSHRTTLPYLARIQGSTGWLTVHRFRRWRRSGISQLRLYSRQVRKKCCLLHTAFIHRLFSLSRFFNSRSILCTTFSLLGSTVAFLLFLYTSTFGMTFNILFLFLAGFTNCGSDTMITGPIAAQLGKQDGRNMQGSVIGFINGRNFKFNTIKILKHF